MILLLQACGKNEVTLNKDTQKTIDELPKAPVNTLISLNNGTKSMVFEHFRLDFIKNEDETYRLQLVNLETLANSTEDSQIEQVHQSPANEKSIAFYQEQPAIVYVKPYADENDPLNFNVKEEPVAEAYETLEKRNYGYMASSIVKSSNGSEFRVQDHYYIASNKAINMFRVVQVLKVSKKDEGFASRVSFFAKGNNRSMHDFDYFAPAVWYKDDNDVVSGAIADSYRTHAIHIKETRLGLPLMMMRDKTSQNLISISHYRPDISTDILENGAKTWEVGEGFQYGALGITKNPNPQIDFVYPATEEPISYLTQGGSYIKRSHPINKGFSHSYHLSIRIDNTDDYNEAMINTWKAHFQLENPEIAEVDVDTVYEVILEDFKLFTDSYDTNGDGTMDAIGMPWEIYIENGRLGPKTFQMGFVGQQIPAAYHMLRYGLNQNDTMSKENGIDIIDFWVERAMTPSGMPMVWYDTWSDSFRLYPSFLRIATDGMEGVLDGYRVAQAYNINKSEWLEAVKNYADFLVENQNDNGSFYRAYDWNGNLFVSGANGIPGDQNTQASSEKNTAIPVRFLIKMYELTSDERYKETALKAGNYVYNELYPTGKYVGGTPDNPNTVDKEAGVYAMYAYNALYALTKKDKWLEAAEQAAIFTLSWTYCYGFPVYNPQDLLAGKVFEEPKTDGLSIIATGHSGADNFNAYIYYELFKLYVYTGDLFYYDSALFIQNNTKKTMNWNEQLGYKYKSLIAEATNFADFVFRSANNGVWLPWSSVANIEPIANMDQTFNETDVKELKGVSLNELRSMLDAYGVGGKPYQK